MVGLSDASDISITQGLSAGQQVVIMSSVPIKDEQTVRTGEGGGRAGAGGATPGKGSGKPGPEKAGSRP